MEKIQREYTAILWAITVAFIVAFFVCRSVHGAEITEEAIGRLLEIYNRTEDGRNAIHGKVTQQLLDCEIKERLRKDGTPRAVTNYFRVDVYEDGYCYTNKGQRTATLRTDAKVVVAKRDNEWRERQEALARRRAEALRKLEVVDVTIAPTSEWQITDLSKRKLKIKLKEFGVWERIKAEMQATPIAEGDSETIWDEWQDSTTLEVNNPLVEVAIGRLREYGLTSEQINHLVKFSAVRSEVR